MSIWRYEQQESYSLVSRKFGQSVKGAMAAGLIVASVISGTSALAQPTPTKWNVWSGTRLIPIDTCLVNVKRGESKTQAFGALLASAVLAPLAKKGVDAVGKALTKAGEDKTSQTKVTVPLEAKVGAAGNVELSKCFLFVKGSFYLNEPNFAVGSKAANRFGKMKDNFEDNFEGLGINFSDTKVNTTVWGRLAKFGVYLAASPDILMELEVVANKGATVLHYEPNLISYTKSSNGRSNNAILVGQLTLQEVGSDKAATADIMFGSYKPSEGPWVFEKAFLQSAAFQGISVNNSPTIVSIEGTTDTLSDAFNALSAEQGGFSKGAQTVTDTLAKKPAEKAALEKKIAESKPDGIPALREQLRELEADIKTLEESKSNLQAAKVLYDDPIAKMKRLKDDFETVDADPKTANEAAGKAKTAINKLDTTKFDRPDTFVETIKNARKAINRVLALVNRDSHYFNISFQLAETQKGSRFLKALGGVLTESADEIKNELELALSKKARTEAEIKEQRELTEVRGVYYTALGGYAEVIDAYCKVTGANAIRSQAAKVRAKQEEVNLAALAAGLSPAFDGNTLLAVTDSDPSGYIGC